MTAWYEPHRSVKSSAYGVNRADKRLRIFGERVGHAVMCPKCDGGGYVMGRASGDAEVVNPYARKNLIVQPVQCPTCRGEGLDPNARQGVEG